MSSWDYIMKFVVVGDSGCGKSSILVQLTDKRFLGQSDPTIGVEFGASLIPLPDGKTIKAQVWDTAGQESFRSITRSYYRGASGALLVFDVSHRPSFTHLTQWLDDLRTYGDTNLAVLVVGNKADLCESGEEGASGSGGGGGGRAVQEEEARAWAEEKGLKYLETSAKTGLNVDEAFATVARQIHASGALDAKARPRQGPGSSFPLAAVAGRRGGKSGGGDGACC